MSDDDSRSAKRRKVVSDLDHHLRPERGPNTNGVIAGTAVNIAAAAQRAAKLVRRSVENSRPSQHTIDESRTDKQESKHAVMTKPTNEDDASSSKESDDEPRRSGRQRKPAAKMVSIMNDAAAVFTPSKPRSANTPQSKKQKAIVSQAATTISAAATPSTIPQVLKPRQTPSSRTKKQVPETLEDPHVLSSKTLEKTPPPSAPVTTPRKRGRPLANAPKLSSTNDRVETPKSIRSNVPVDKGESPSDDHEPVIDVAEEVVHLENDQVTKDLQAALAIAGSKLRDAVVPVAAMSKIVLEKLAQRRPIPLTHLQDEYDKIYTLLESTVTAGEGNSMVIVGARGSGKTTLVNKALAELGKIQKEHFHIVRLNGFLQVDDKLALREIWRQLGREMELDDEAGGVTKSYADTLTMLLALLSHPDEIAAGQEGDEASAYGTAGGASNQTAKSVILIMDEFDLFATHARQTLLYNLLDIAQSRKAPIAVLGLTTRFDVTERLEKRVKSRFSHRYVHLPLAKSMRAFSDTCKAAVLLQADELSFEEQVALSQTQASESKSLAKQSRMMDCLAVWNTSVHLLFLNHDFHRAYIRDTFYLTKSVSAVLTSLLLPMSSLQQANGQDEGSSLLPANHFLSFSRAQHLQAPTSSLQLLLPSLSELQLSLLIAAARLDIIHDTDTCSFGMAYAHYVELASKARLHSAAAGALATGGAGARVWGRDVARGEWEVLIRRGLLLPSSDLSGASGVTVVSTSGLVKVDVRLEEISSAVKGMSAVMERWCKQI